MKTKGFTLVELLVVIAILAILATVSVVGYTSFIERAELSNAETEAHQVKSSINSMLMADDEYVLVTAADPTTGSKVVKIYAKEVAGKVQIWAKTATFVAEVVDSDPNTDGNQTVPAHCTYDDAVYTGEITLDSTSDFAELPGKLYANAGTLLYIYEEGAETGIADDKYIDVFAK